MTDGTGTALAEGAAPETRMIGERPRREGITPPAGARLRLGHSTTPLRDAFAQEVTAWPLGEAPARPAEDAERRKRDLLAFLVG